MPTPSLMKVHPNKESSCVFIAYLILGSLATLFHSSTWVLVQHTQLGVFQHKTKTIGDYLYYPFWYGGIILMAWVARTKVFSRFTHPIGLGLGGRRVVYLRHVPMAPGLETGHAHGRTPFFSWFTVEAHCPAMVYTTSQLSSFFACCTFGGAKRKATIHDPGAKPEGRDKALLSPPISYYSSPHADRPHAKNPTPPPRATPRSATKPLSTKGPLPRGQYTLDAEKVEPVEADNHPGDWGRMRVLSTAQQR